MIEEQELNIEEFSAFGTFYDMMNPEGTKMGTSPIEYWPDLSQVSLGHGSTVSFGMVKVAPREYIIRENEYHSNCGEGMLPLNGDILIHLAPPSGERIREDEIRVFRVPAGTFVSIKPGVWHHAPFAAGKNPVNVLIVLPPRTYQNDSHAFKLKEGLPIHYDK